MTPTQARTRTPPVRIGGRFDLVTLDLDGTLLRADTMDIVLRTLGKDAEADAAANADDPYTARFAAMCTLSLQEIHRALRKAPWLADISDGVRRLKEAGIQVALLSDTPQVITDYAAKWNLADAMCSPCTVKDGKPATVERRAKKGLLEARLKEWNLEARSVCHVGDGVDDIPVWKSVGGSVALWGEPEAEKAAQVGLREVESLHDVVEVILGLNGS